MCSVEFAWRLQHGALAHYHCLVSLFVRHLLVVLVQELVKPGLLLFVTLLGRFHAVVEVSNDAEAEEQLQHHDAEQGQSVSIQ